MPVPKAEEVSQKIAQMISKFSERVDEIFVTLQQRPSYHIGHPSFWQDKKGSPPDTFIHIDSMDIKNKNYLAMRREHSQWCTKYFELLGKKEIRNIIVFPEHCVVGTKGAAIVDSIAAALRTWEKNTLRSVHYISKGTSSRTEHYSAFQAVVNIKEEESTHLNKQLLNRLLQYNTVIICGHTLSHGVKYTVLDFLAQTTPAKVHTNFVLLPDLCSTLRDFRNGAQHFLQTIKSDYAKDNRIVISSSKSLHNIFEGNFLGNELNSSNQTMQTVNSRRFGAALSIYDTEVQINNDEFFNVEGNGTQLLGDGCYLLFNEKNYGSLAAVWYKARANSNPDDIEQLKGCLGFFKPGLGTKIPDFKFRKGNEELVREISKSGLGKRKKFYQGILKFIQECRRFDGSFILRYSEDTEELLMDSGLYGLDVNGNIIHIDAEHFVDPSSFSVVSCIPRSANAYKGVAKQTKQIFIHTGENLGATLELR